MLVRISKEQNSTFSTSLCKKKKKEKRFHFAVVSIQIKYHNKEIRDNYSS